MPGVKRKGGGGAILPKRPRPEPGDAGRNRQDKKDEEQAKKRFEAGRRRQQKEKEQAEKIEQVLDLRAGQVVRHAAKAAIVPDVFARVEAAIGTLCHISKLAGALAASFFTLVLSPTPVVMDDGFVLPAASSQQSSDMFGESFFEHLFKACTWDSTVQFEPTLQLARCV